MDSLLADADIAAELQEISEMVTAGGHWFCSDSEAGDEQEGC